MNPEEYARKAHEGQTYGPEKPYTVHLEAVVALVRTVDDSPEAVATAWLHDVLEDTEATFEDLAHRFGVPVAQSVILVTDPETPNNRKGKKETLHRRLRSLPGSIDVPRRALLVKAADRLANVRACVAANDKRRLKMYRGEQEAFRLAAFRPKLCEAIWSELDELLAE